MIWTRRIVNALRSVGRERPKPGVLMTPRPEDSVRDYPSAGLTPSRLAAILREADDGSLATPMQLFEEMEEKDAHLFAVANTRRLALTGLSWEIVSAAEVRDGVDRRPADEAADYCRKVIRSLDTFDEVMQHLSLAVGRNISIAEIVWDFQDGSLQPVDLLPVDFTRIVFDDLDRPRILTEEENRDGIAPPPHKFIIHTPHSVSGHPQRGGLLRVTAMVYLAKNLALKDWMIFSEIFGMPIRIGRYQPNASPEEKRELLNMLESLGSNATAVFSQAIDLQVVDAKRGSLDAPYERLIDFLNREISKAWLGQTLTTDIVGQSGSVSASRVHERVRQDILTDDRRKEERTLRRDLLGPLTAFRFGPDAPVPFFRRKLTRMEDLGEVANVLDVAINRLGLEVSEAWMRETLRIPRPDSGEPTMRRKSV